MFEKYDINDLYIASIDVRYPMKEPEINIGGMFIAGIAGYGYITILWKNKDKFFDLQDMSKDLKLPLDYKAPMNTNYVIDYIEPLSKYYTQEGKQVRPFTKRRAIKTSMQYYDAFHQDHLNSLENAIK